MNPSRYDPIARVARALERWGVTVDHVELLSGRAVVASWARDPQAPDDAALAQEIAEAAQELADDRPAGVLCTLRAQAGARALGAVPLRVLPMAAPRDVRDELVATLHTALRESHTTLVGAVAQITTAQTAALASMQTRIAELEHARADAARRADGAEALAREAIDALAEAKKAGTKAGIGERLLELVARDGMPMLLGAVSEAAAPASSSSPEPTPAPAPTSGGGTA